MHMFEFQRPGQRSCMHEHPWGWKWHFVKEAFSAKSRRRIPCRVALHSFIQRPVLIQPGGLRAKENSMRDWHNQATEDTGHRTHR